MEISTIRRHQRRILLPAFAGFNILNILLLNAECSTMSRNVWTVAIALLLCSLWSLLQLLRACAGRPPLSLRRQPPGLSRP